MSDLNHFFLHSRELSASNKHSDILLLSACITVTERSKLEITAQIFGGM